MKRSDPVSSSENRNDRDGRPRCPRWFGVVGCDVLRALQSASREAPRFALQPAKREALRNEVVRLVS